MWNLTSHDHIHFPGSQGIPPPGRKSLKNWLWVIGVVGQEAAPLLREEIQNLQCVHNTEKRESQFTMCHLKVSFQSVRCLGFRKEGRC